METNYSSGSEITDQLQKFAFSGNIISSTWYKTITRETGYPNLTAIVILSDIVYWYRPQEQRDELTGELVGFVKKYKKDLLQRNYQQLADQFGVSKRVAAGAIADLERLGVIKRVFRTENQNGIVLSNILYIELNVEVLKELTYPNAFSGPVQQQIEEDAGVVQQEEKEALESHISEDVTPITFKCDRVKKEDKIATTTKCNPYHIKKGEGVRLNVTPPTFECETYTENTTKNTNIYINHPSRSKENIIADREKGERGEECALSFDSAEKEIMQRFKNQIGYESLEKEFPQHVCLLQGLLDTVVCTFLNNQEKLKVGQTFKQGSMVQAQFSKLKAEHIVYLLSDISAYSKTTQIYSPAALYMKKLYEVSLLPPEAFAAPPSSKCSQQGPQSRDINKNKNKFNNFQQRNYSKNELLNLEKALLN